MTLAIYLVHKFLYALFVVVSAFAILTFLFEFEATLSSYSKHGVTAESAAGMALLHMPARIHKLVPAMFALAALWTSVRLAVTNEVTVIRAAGTSGATAFAAPILVAFLLGGFWVAVINPLGAAMTKKRHELVSELTGSRNEVFLESSGFFWFRQILDGQQTVLRASSTSRGLEFKDLHVFVFDSTETPVTRIYAEHGRLLDDLTEVSPQSVFGSSAEADPVPGLCVENYKQWNVRNDRTNPESTAIRSDEACFATKLTAEQILDSFDPPIMIPFWRLTSQIASLDLSGFSTVSHRVFLHMELAKPLLFAAMVLVGGGFTLRRSSAINAAATIVVSVLCTLMIIYVQEFARIMGEAETIPVLAAAWATPAAALLMAVGIVSYLEGR